MQQIVFSQRLGGRLTTVAPGVLDAALAGECEPATLVAQLVFTDERRFRVSGEIRFDEDDSLSFRTLGRGLLDPAPQAGLRQGTTVLEICGGSGRFDGARGRITSNFVVSADGEITDHQLGVVFVAERPTEEP